MRDIYSGFGDHGKFIHKFGDFYGKKYDGIYGKHFTGVYGDNIIGHKYTPYIFDKIHPIIDTYQY